MKNFILFFTGLIFFSCQDHKKSVSINNSVYQPEYAHLFLIDSAGALNTLDHLGGVSSKVTYNALKDFNRIVVLNSTHFGYFEVLQSTSKIVGITEKGRLEQPYDSLLKHCVEVGRNGALDLEKILACEPDLVICNAFQRSELRRLPQSIALLEVDEYNESDPLAFPEWLLFFGQLLGKSEQAQVEFKHIEQRYLSFPPSEEEFAVGTLYRFGNKYFSSPCEGRLSQIIERMGFRLKCFGKGHQTAEITKEQALVMLNQLDYLFFVDWHQTARTRQELMEELDLGVFSAQIVYCTAKQSHYYEELMMRPDVLMDALSKAINEEENSYFVKF